MTTPFFSGGPPPPLHPPPSRAVQLFNEWYDYHQKNPHIYALICRYAEQAVRAGHKEYAIATIWELIRWEFTVVTVDENFALPNNHRAYYARHWLKQHPEHPKFFRTCELRSERRFATDRYGRSL